VTEVVLDASALIAFLRNEPGAERVSDVMGRACISAVNMAETLSKFVEYGKALPDIVYQVERLRIPVIPFDLVQATTLASLWKPTRIARLSLGDRACLGLGLVNGWPVLTTDRQWQRFDVGVEVIPIR
jgi:PIN domain nuclease of toxin-antitoxin system